MNEFGFLLKYSEVCFRMRTCTGGVVEVAILAHIASSATVIVLAGAVAGNHVADVTDGAQRIARANWKLCFLS